jgi:hypothetical protein
MYVAIASAVADSRPQALHDGSILWMRHAPIARAAGL